ncbi:type II toxin-antitoxin system VapC family toxin [Bradyrhizobium sp. CCGUVB4N]|uniref:PIN domain-containing protein n=1 Tax=Bradyrhizobium sp. CCGUVB4N TaxID=2949631 RepID=UPI0020B1C782|nr:PIN domain-containing protein [Bradyrhizobium sp. CCGUVB4N]MCP3385935.1 type II toxin-antitoxin system VapC family toxin [Bradyrhizobium sp. CCGUVB4N]
MRIVVNDTSCLVDLRKAGLLHATLLLPYSFQIALPLVHSELNDFTRAEIEDLTSRGLQVIDLAAEGVARALTFRSAYPALSFNDCLSMALAESQPGSILLTGDQSLRNRASTIGIEVHGVLWVSDQLETSGQITFADLHAGLSKLESDPLVFVPRVELANRLARLAKLLDT